MGCCNQRKNEFYKVGDVFIDAGFFQRLHILFTTLQRYYHPGVTTGDQLAVHCKTGRPAIPVHVGVDIDEEEMSQNSTDQSYVFRTIPVQCSGDTRSLFGC